MTARRLVQEELAARLCLGEAEARRLVTAALALPRLSMTSDALAGGLLDPHRAGLVAEGVDPLALHHRAAALAEGESPVEAERAAVAVSARVEELIFPRACGQSPRELASALAEAVMRVDPVYAEARRQSAACSRRVTYRSSAVGGARGTTGLDGTGDLWARLPAHLGQAIFDRIEARARLAKSQGDPRALHELRADAFADICLNRTSRTDDADLTDGEDGEDGEDEMYLVVPEATRDGQVPPIPGDPYGNDPTGLCDDADAGAGKKPHPRSARGSTHGSARKHEKASGRGFCAQIGVLVALDTLTHADDAPAHLVGHGPITAAYARALAHTHTGTGTGTGVSTWRRIVTDPLSGTLLDYGRTRYRPPAPLAEHVRLRDQTCTHPGCTRHGEYTDLDHIVPWPTGITAATNLQLKCRRHHQLKTEGHWHDHTSTDPRHAPGTVIITSPTGQKYLAHPTQLTRPRTARV